MGGIPVQGNLRSVAAEECIMSKPEMSNAERVENAVQVMVLALSLNEIAPKHAACAALEVSISLFQSGSLPRELFLEMCEKAWDGLAALEAVNAPGSGGES